MQTKTVTTAAPTLSDRSAVKSESTQASRSDIRYPYRIPIMARTVPKLWIGPDLFRHGIGGHSYRSIASEPIAPAAHLIGSRSRTGTLSTNVAECGAAAELPGVGEHWSK